MADLSMGAGSLAGMRDDYVAQTRRKRMYSGILLIIFIALFAAGWKTALVQGGLGQQRNHVKYFCQDGFTVMWECNYANTRCNFANRFACQWR